MPICFSDETADDVWQNAADMFRNGHCEEDTNSRGGLTHELMHVCFTIHDPCQRWVVSRCPAINPAFALAEVIWIMSGSNDSKVLNFWNPILPRFAGNTPVYPGAYGHRLRYKFGFDQLERAYSALKSNSSSRQIVLQIWDSSSDLPDFDGVPQSQDIPCNICSMLKVRNGRLYWTQIIRSNDLFLGVPHNFVQFTSMQEILAGWLGLKMGPYVQWSDSLHVYDRDISKIQTKNSKSTGLNEDTLMLEKEQSESVFDKIYSLMVEFSSDNFMLDSLIKTVENIQMPNSYKNILYVISADVARRFHNNQMADHLMDSCSNILYRRMWKNWLERSNNSKTL